MGMVLGIALLPCIVRAQESQPPQYAKPADTTAGQALASDDPQGDDTTGDRAVVSSAADGASAGADQSGGGAAAGGPSTATPPVPGAPAQQNATQNTAEGNFFQRLANAYKEDWKGTAASGPAPAFRGDPAPVNGPPFPFSSWPIGGTVTIG